jgi:hypothetical protein
MVVLESDLFVDKSTRFQLLRVFPFRMGVSMQIDHIVQESDQDEVMSVALPLLEVFPFRMEASL